MARAKGGTVHVFRRSLWFQDPWLPYEFDVWRRNLARDRDGNLGCGGELRHGLLYFPSEVIFPHVAECQARLVAGNPNHRRNWMRKGPVLNHLPLLAELFSLTSRRYGWINVSDGGHFDNTGVYEMLRRHCRQILLIDADSTHSGIANASRKARIDLAADLTLEYKAAGNIPYERYEILYSDRTKGRLVRIYPAVVDKGKWSAFESREQQRVGNGFPEDPLLNQFFAETLFESYRKLGFASLKGVLDAKVEPPDEVKPRGSIAASV